MKNTFKTATGHIYTTESTIPDDLYDALINNNAGNLLEEYRFLYNTYGGQDVKPFALEDGRVVVIFNEFTTLVYSSFEGYLCSIKEMFNTKQISSTFPKLQITYLPDNKKLFYHQIDEVEGNVITKIFPEYQPVRIPSRMVEIKTYINDNEEILEHHSIDDNYMDDSYFLFGSKEDYDIYRSNANILKTLNNARRTKLDSRGQTNIPIACRNPYGKSFPNHVEELANQLPGLLNIKKEKLTPDYKGLNYLQHRLFRNVITADFADRLFLPLLAFYGKTFIDAVGGEWKMYQEDVADTWIPDIEINGELIQIYDVVLMALDYKSKRYIPFAAPFGKYLGKIE